MDRGVLRPSFIVALLPKHRRWTFYEEVGHVLKGEIGQRTAGRTHLLIKDRGQFIVGPNVPVDRKEYTITTLEELGHLPFENSISHTKSGG